MGLASRASDMAGSMTSTVITNSPAIAAKIAKGAYKAGSAAINKSTGWRKKR